MTVSDESCLQLLVTRLETHYPLADADRRALLALPCTLRDREAQSYLVREGDRPEHCGLLVSGFAFRHKLTGDGARQIIAINIPGEAVDFQHLLFPEADHNVQMLTRGTVAMIPREAIEDLIMANPEVSRAVQIFTLVEASMFREWTVNVGRRDARGRIAHLLCEFAVRLTAQGLHTNGSFELPMSQEQLADATGLTTVHVNRTLKSMEADGLIERNRRVVRFPEWKRLREVGDFNSRYLHLNETALAAH